VKYDEAGFLSWPQIYFFPAISGALMVNVLLLLGDIKLNMALCWRYS
jgi:hypothetical protein